MNKVYKSVKSTLVSVDYNFDYNSRNENIMLETRDVVEIKAISDSNILLTVERKLLFTGLPNTFLSVVYYANIGLAEKINKTQFEKDIKKGVTVLNSIFIDVSLIIAQITDKSPFGAIISPPIYNEDTVEIK